MPLTPLFPSHSALPTRASQALRVLAAAPVPSCTRPTSQGAVSLARAAWAAAALPWTPGSQQELSWQPGPSAAGDRGHFSTHQPPLDVQTVRR